MDSTRGKRAVVVLSSSEDEEEEEEEEQDEDTCNDFDYDSTDEDYDRAQSSDSDHSDDDNNDDDDEDDDSIVYKVITLLREGKDIESLKLRQCKAYLRKHGLRISGTRAVCVARIWEHWRLKNGSGYTLYPRSSFIINCTGDVCKGDAVLFRQQVYERFDRMTRHGRVRGSRTIAGRVVKESYGTAKQQHTFTVEVLWSSGVQRLPPLFPLLVKGRNLYKLKTYRQRWKDEADRVQVLSEKHRRGAAARCVRAMRQKKNSCYSNESKGSKRKHEMQNKKRSKKGRSFEVDKVGHLDGRRARATTFQPQDTISSTRATGKENAPSRATRARHKSAEFDHYQVPMHLVSNPYHQASSNPSQINFQMRNGSCDFFDYQRGLVQNITGFPPSRHHVGHFASRSHPPLVPSDIHYSRTNPGYNFEMMNLNAENIDRPLQLPPRRNMYGWRNYGI